MTSKQTCLLIPGAALPYTALAALAIILTSGKHPYIMDTIFGGSGLNLGIALAIYAIASLVLGLLFFGLALKSSIPAISLAKTAMLIKLAQIPAYLATFALSLVFILSIFTIPFIPILILLNYLSVFTSGLVALAAILSSSRKQGIPVIKNFLLIILQFIFCADVAAAVILYRRLRTP